MGSVLVIAALLGERLVNNPNTNSDPWEAAPVIVVVPVPIPPPNPSPSPIPSEPESPWRLGAFLHTTDPDDLPKSPVLAGLVVSRSAAHSAFPRNRLNPKLEPSLFWRHPMRCQWIVIAYVAGLLLPARGFAQPVVQPTDGKLIVKSKVSPPRPRCPRSSTCCFRNCGDQQPGNQVQAFYKCFMEQHAFYHDKGEMEKRERWSTAPLADLAGEKGLIGYGGSGLRQADYAARLESVDWGILIQFKIEGINLLLPDVQQLRQLAGATRCEPGAKSLRKDYDAAVRTLQTMFALAHTFNQHPTLIGQLVGIAIVNMTLGVIEEFQQQPGAPSLFWASPICRPRSSTFARECRENGSGYRGLRPIPQGGTHPRSPAH